MLDNFEKPRRGSGMVVIATDAGFPKVIHVSSEVGLCSLVLEPPNWKKNVKMGTIFKTFGVKIPKNGWNHAETTIKVIISLPSIFCGTFWWAGFIWGRNLHQRLPCFFTSPQKKCWENIYPNFQWRLVALKRPRNSKGAGLWINHILEVPRFLHLKLRHIGQLRYERQGWHLQKKEEICVLGTKTSKTMADGDPFLVASMQDALKVCFEESKHQISPSTTYFTHHHHMAELRFKPLP